jgi:hypothetical protein
MERSPGDAAAHPDDADLLRLLDGEPALSATHDVPAHLEACPACAARADRLRAQRRRLAALLLATDVPVPPREPLGRLLEREARRRPLYARRALRAAGVLLVVVTGTLAAQPAVRRWVEQHWTRATSRSDQRTPAASAPTSSPPAGAAGSALSFDPGSGPFTIRFDVRPTAGTLTILGDAGSRVIAERTGGENLELVVMPHGLQVRNARGAPASFVLRVPRAARRVEVRYDARPTADVVVDLDRQSQRVIVFGDGTPRPTPLTGEKP